MKRVLAIILGGGAGTRLYPLTKMRAKPAVPLAGKYRLIDIPVSNCINSEINKIYVLTQFNSASLNRHLTMSYNLSAGFGQGFVEVLAAQQTPESPSWFEGTADAVRKYQWLFQEWDVDHYLILSGDQLYRMDYSKFVQHHIDTGAHLTVGALPVDQAQAEGFGLMRTGSGGRIAEFREKPKGEALDAMRVDTQSLGLSAEEAAKRPFLASMGIYVFSRETLFDLLIKHPTATDFGKEIIPYSISKHNVFSFQYEGYWTDIGNIHSFFEANLALTQDVPEFNLFDNNKAIYTRARMLPPAKISGTTLEKTIVAEGCIINASRVENSVLGIRTRIGYGSTIVSCYIMGTDFYETLDEMNTSVSNGLPKLGIGERCYIKNSIIDKNCRIGNDVRINGSDHNEIIDHELYTIKDGIVVVKKGAIIPDGFKIN